jgi:hypothetical protein
MTEPSTPRTAPAGAGKRLPEPALDGARPASSPSGDYRDDLASRRWDAAPLRNPEVDKTDPRIAVAAIVILSAVTLLILVVGYASGFWELPDSGATSGAVAALEFLA